MDTGELSSLDFIANQWNCFPCPIATVVAAHTLRMLDNVNFGFIPPFVSELA